ncbi:hypothetical protein Hypma_005614 [Hypsizygus marmoreus]|uniref:Uncharacterized protein n=1 Tax=Hypsizygus marmoreus TaxID=39966 RepID=A0A369K3W9_HYPMA|nr:hypothetical protein Hypma_005614 [Hypsizygus marmoreus]
MHLFDCYSWKLPFQLLRSPSTSAPFLLRVHRMQAHKRLPYWSKDVTITSARIKPDSPVNLPPCPRNFLVAIALHESHHDLDAYVGPPSQRMSFSTNDTLFLPLPIYNPRQARGSISSRSQPLFRARCSSLVLVLALALVLVRLFSHRWLDHTTGEGRTMRSRPYSFRDSERSQNFASLSPSGWNSFTPWDSKDVAGTYLIGRTKDLYTTPALPSTGRPCLSRRAGCPSRDSFSSSPRVTVHGEGVDVIVSILESALTATLDGILKHVEDACPEHSDRSLRSISRRDLLRASLAPLAVQHGVAHVRYLFPLPMVGGLSYARYGRALVAFSMDLLCLGGDSL